MVDVIQKNPANKCLLTQCLEASNYMHHAVCQVKYTTQAGNRLKSGRIPSLARL